MSEVTVGPKYYRSRLPVGKVDELTAQQIELADQGQLGKQVFNFNLKIKDLGEKDGVNEGLYSRAYVINGHCRFKRYGVIDKLKYAIGRLFPVKGKND